MFLQLLALLATLFPSIKEGEERWVTLPLNTSFEYQVLGEGISIDEYHQMLEKEGLEERFRRIERKILRFRGEEELKKWLVVEFGEGAEERLEAMYAAGMRPGRHGELAFVSRKLNSLLYKK